MLGKSVKCKNCASIFLVEPVAAKVVVPAKNAPTTATSMQVSPLPPKKSAPNPVDEDLTEVLLIDDDYQYEEEHRPARKSSKKPANPDQPKKKGSGMLWLLLGGGGAFAFAMLLVCMGGLWFFVGGGFGKTIDVAAYDQIRAGMTEDEVCAILGKPTQTFDAGQVPFGMDMGVGPSKTLRWIQDENSINCEFTNGKATKLMGHFKDAKGGTMRVGFGTEGKAGQNPPARPAQNRPPDLNTPAN